MTLSLASSSSHLMRHSSLHMFWTTACYKVALLHYTNTISNKLILVLLPPYEYQWLFIQLSAKRAA